MNIRTEPNRFLDEVEIFSGQKFFYRKELAWWAEIAAAENKRNDFEEIIFLAKFLVKANAVLEREGNSSDETEKLSREFSEKTNKISLLIQAFLQKSPEDVKSAFAQRFLSLITQHLMNFLDFMKELSRLKDYELDKRSKRL